MVFFTLIFIVTCIALYRRRLFTKDGRRADASFLAFAIHEIAVRLLALALLVIQTILKVRRRRNPALEREELSIGGKLKRNEQFETTFYGSDKAGNVIHLNIQETCLDGCYISITIQTGGKLLSFEERSTVSGFRPHGVYAVGGLRIQTVDEVGIYRILFSGLMKGEDGAYEEVTFRFWFRNLSDASDFGKDFHPLSLARCVLDDRKPLKTLKNILCRGFAAEQASQGRGRWRIGCDGALTEISLYGIRAISKTKISPEPRQALFSMLLRMDNGLIASFHVKNEGANAHPKQIVEGFAFYQTNYVYPIEWSDFCIEHASEDIDKLHINFKWHGRMFKIFGERLSKASRSSLEEQMVHEMTFKLTVNDNRTGYGLVVISNGASNRLLRSERRITQVSDLGILPISRHVPLTIPLNDDLCRHDELTGGKAARLADILAVTRIQRNPPSFVVPDGFAITTLAYEQHLQANKKLQEEVANILQLAEKQEFSQLEKACENVHHSFSKSVLNADFVQALEDQMERSFGRDWDAVYTAVRSSAVGEDGVEASGAGQMETFLGRRGIARITEAIKLCWASHFSFRAIEYRRQLCAKLDTPMAVVVQRLVRADVAGVLFTRHPDTGSTARSLINACYGIGEGVVSGHVQPDTISVYKTSPDGNDVRIVYDSLGEKASAYKLDEEKGEVTQQITASSNEQCCLTEQEIRQLCEAGQFIESMFDNASGRDVEFALVKGENGSPSQVLILQARPITTSENEDEWELLHELDTPVSSEEEWITTANIQEMMPGAMSPLSAYNFIYGLSNCASKHEEDVWLRAPRRFPFPRGIGMFYQHCFINFSTIGSGLTDVNVKRICDVAFFGREVPEMTIEHFKEFTDMDSAFWRLVLSLLVQRGIFFRRHYIDKLSKRIDAFQIGKPTDARQLLDRIEHEIHELSRETWTEHLAVTGDAAAFPNILMTILDKTMNWGPQIYSDVAMMLSNCTNVYSADVPAQLEEIGRAIKEDPQASSIFAEKSRTELAKWFASNESGKHGQRFRAFIEKHGHRCVRESDIREKSWRQEPEKVVDALQIIVSTSNSKPKEQKEALSVHEAIGQLKTPVNFVQKLFIKYFLPVGRFMVGQRERTKSYGVKTADIQRRAYYHLADLMKAQGQLPDVDLLFFLKPREIRFMLHEGTSPRLISKAQRRRKLFPMFQKMSFSELVQGPPEPIASSLPALPSNVKSIKGIAVGQGSVQGKARVIRTLADANQIEQGDILIVRYTDVGWTPYFPLLSGLVTELGGLISHGAVVAREYGLPCLVGCKQATDIIKTGDQVRIDGQTGEIYVI